MEMIAPGIWKNRFGIPEEHTPVNMKESECMMESLNKLPCVDIVPIDSCEISFEATNRGCTVELPLKKQEKIYGFGLQLKSVNQTYKKKCLRVNADPIGDTGDTHAPVPLYVSTAGYGIFVDTARYVTFNCGNSQKLCNQIATYEDNRSLPPENFADLYKQNDSVSDRSIIIEIPNTKGIDIYIFAGPDMLTAVQRYNLFSGGGCLLPLWGFGIWYRPDFTFSMGEMLDQAKSFRKEEIPCDVYGPEPSYLSHSYSCSFKWDSKRFPDPELFIADMTKMNYKLNLWEHAFTHPSSPFYEEMKPYSGDYVVWNGLVPDFSMMKAREIFAQYHKKEFVDKGITGFKLDECDSSDYTNGWSFPNCTKFPSGLDGELMHNMFGVLYQRTLFSIFKQSNKRTMNQVRASHALASPLPYVLYSDLYNHRDFVRGVVNMGFSGLLWSPEVRWSDSVEDLIRRIQTLIFSPLAIVNAFNMPYPPWKQYDMEKNRKREIFENYKEVEDICRSLFELRMSFIPYIYSSFARYRFEGKPPFRALVMDYPSDEHTYDIDDEYLMGDSILIAPIFSGQTERKVYLPEGNWYCFWSGIKYEGSHHYKIEMDLEKIPVFIKEGTLLPLAKHVEYIKPDTCFEIYVRCYGDNCKDFTLYEDDGYTYNYENNEYNLVRLSIENGEIKMDRKGNYKGEKYNICSSSRITVF